MNGLPNSEEKLEVLVKEEHLCEFHVKFKKKYLQLFLPSTFYVLLFSNVKYLCKRTADFTFLKNIFSLLSKINDELDNAGKINERGNLRNPKMSCKNSMKLTQFSENELQKFDEINAVFRKFSITREEINADTDIICSILNISSIFQIWYVLFYFILGIKHTRWSEWVKKEYKYHLKYQSH